MLFRTAEGSKLPGVVMNPDVETAVTEISGRRFELTRPWQHIIPD